MKLTQWRAYSAKSCASFPEALFALEYALNNVSVIKRCLRIRGSSEWQSVEHRQLVHVRHASVQAIKYIFFGMLRGLSKESSRVEEDDISGV